MLVSILAILAFSKERSYLADKIGGNWTVEITHPGLPASESKFYQLRAVQSQSKDNFTITVFEDANSTTAIDTYLISFLEKETLSFRHEQDPETEAVIANFSASVKHHLSAIGNYKNYVFNFIIGTPHRMDFSLFDHESGKWTIVHLIQDVSQPTFFQKYGMMIFAGGMMVFSMVLRTKLAPKYTPPPQAPRQPQQNTTEKEQAEQTEKKPKVEVVEEDENEKDDRANGDANTEDNENSGEANTTPNENRNTRDDINENGKVKNE